MNQNVAGKLTVGILDYNRPAESERCLKSIHSYIQVDNKKILYLSNGGQQDYVINWYNEGLIDSLLLNKTNWGCGLAFKQMAQAALTEWIMMVQSDQYAARVFSNEEFEFGIEYLKSNPGVLYIDLAGNQGNGNMSERALLINRRKYLDLPDMDNIIGGPGPYAQSKWTERHMQDMGKQLGLTFVSAAPVFADNGAYSQREYGPEYGNAVTRHRTDTKRLWILKPFSKRADGFPNLTLTDEEWAEVLEGRWPIEGKIPEHDKPHSFVVPQWGKDVYQ